MQMPVRLGNLPFGAVFLVACIRAKERAESTRFHLCFQARKMLNIDAVHAALGFTFTAVWLLVAQIIVTDRWRRHPSEERVSDTELQEREVKLSRPLRAFPQRRNGGSRAGTGRTDAHGWREPAPTRLGIALRPVVPAIECGSRTAIRRVAR